MASSDPLSTYPAYGAVDMRLTWYEASFGNCLNCLLAGEMLKVRVPKLGSLTDSGPTLNDLEVTLKMPSQVHSSDVTSLGGHVNFMGRPPDAPGKIFSSPGLPSSV